jgi:uncharacterized protein YqhQ
MEDIEKKLALLVWSVISFWFGTAIFLLLASIFHTILKPAILLFSATTLVLAACLTIFTVLNLIWKTE